jgi:hypothetical protein
LPFVQTAMEAALDSSDDVYEKLKTRAAQLWTARRGDEVEAICITRVEEYTRGKACAIWICTGTGMEEWKHHMATIEAWAVENGCTRMKHTARPGWQRVLKPMGYATTHVLLEKDL